MSCEQCGRSPQDGITLFRQNAKGQPGRWKCANCGGEAADPIVRSLVDILEEQP